MHTIALGLNHRTAPVELREQLAFPARARAAALTRLSRVPGVHEVALLSTCNRTEVYAVVEDLHPGFRSLIEALAAQRQISQSTFSERLYRLQGTGAVRHLFQVTSGLDSMVLGESQILGQVKDAYGAAQQQGTVGKNLHALFSQAIRSGKRVHTETEIGENTTSIGHAAVQLVSEVFPDLSQRRVLLVGAGKMGRVTARYLADKGVREIQVANRTEEHARRLASEYGGVALGLDEIEKSLAHVDVVITSTDAGRPLILAPMVERAMSAQRQGRPLFFVDIAVPRDVDPAVAAIGQVFLYDVDDLEAVVDANLQERQRERHRVERIIDEEVEKFEAWQRRQDVVPLIKELRRKLESIRRAELERALADLPHLSPQDRQTLDKMTAVIINKILDDPTQRIKEAAGVEGSDAYAQVVSELFDLTQEDNQAVVDAVGSEDDGTPGPLVPGTRAQAQ